MINPKTFRASYSVLSQWSQGNWQDAIKMYFKMPTPTYQAMAEGKAWHEKWANFIDKVKMLPVEFTNQKLIAPQTELKIVVHLADWLDLVGVIDCYDEKTIYEFKTGSTNSTANYYETQAGVYGILAKLTDREAEKCHIMHYNQHTKEADTTIIWLTDKMLEGTLEWIQGNAAEMHSYLVDNNLYEELGK